MSSDERLPAGVSMAAYRSVMCWRCNHRPGSGPAWLCAPCRDDLTDDRSSAWLRLLRGAVTTRS